MPLNVVLDEPGILNFRYARCWHRAEGPPHGLRTLTESVIIGLISEVDGITSIHSLDHATSNYVTMHMSFQVISEAEKAKK